MGIRTARGTGSLRQRDAPYLLRRLYRKVRPWLFYLRVRLGLTIALLRGRGRSRSRFRSHGLTAPLVVSLTSYPPRFPTLALTLQCLLHQSVRPDHLILWIAEADRQALPESVLRLTAQGLSIRSCDDLKSYKKLIPALQVFGRDVYHVVVDDDMYYASDWLEGLVTECDDHSVVCHFSRIWRAADGSIPTYRDWPAMAPGSTSRHGLLIGHGGVLFPPGSLGAEACDYDLARKLCPLQDDIWWSWQVLRRGYRIKRVHKRSRRCSWPGADDVVALSRDNNRPGGGNDTAIARMLAHYGDPSQA